jgi:integrase
LTASRSLFKYAALRHSEHASVIARVLSIPPKRHQKRQISVLTAQEPEALIDAPDQSCWEGRRDRAMLIFTIQTGLRVSELIALNTGDIQLGTGAHVRCEGNSRKQRTVPLTTPAQAARSRKRQPVDRASRTQLPVKASGASSVKPSCSIAQRRRAPKYPSLKDHRDKSRISPLATSSRRARASAIVPRIKMSWLLAGSAIP